MIIKTTIATAALLLSMNAFAAVSDLSSVTHGDKAGQALQVGQITAPRLWCARIDDSEVVTMVASEVPTASCMR